MNNMKENTSGLADSSHSSILNLETPSQTWPGIHPLVILDPVKLKININHQITKIKIPRLR